MARTAWWGVGSGGVLLAGGLVSGLWPLSAAGAFVALVSAVVVVLADLARRREEGRARGAGR